MEEVFDFICSLIMAIIFAVVWAIGAAILIYAIGWILVKMGIVGMIGAAFNSCGT